MSFKRKNDMITTDWTICSLCQEGDTNNLLDPKRNPIQVKRDKTYQTLAANLTTLSQLNSLPLGINLDRLNDGSRIENSLRVNNAKWHKNCYQQCSVSAIQRAKEKLSKQYETNQSSPIKRLRPSGEKDESCDDKPECFICGDPIDSEDLYHKACTTEIDTSSNDMAKKAKRSDLLAKKFKSRSSGTTGSHGSKY